MQEIMLFDVRGRFYLLPCLSIILDKDALTLVTDTKPVLIPYEMILYFFYTNNELVERNLQ